MRRIVAQDHEGTRPQHARAARLHGIGVRMVVGDGNVHRPCDLRHGRFHVAPGIVAVVVRLAL